MKQICKLGLFLVLACVPINPQTLKIKMGGSLDFLLKSYSKVDGSAFEEVEKPSFGSFYNSSCGFIADAAFYIWSDQKTGYLFIGFNFEKSAISTSEIPVRFILGERISQYKFTPYLAFGNFMDSMKRKSFLFGFLGISIKNYYGEGSLTPDYTGLSSSVKMKYDYNNILAFRMGAGLDFENIAEKPIFISLIAYFDWGAADRGNAEGTYGGNKIMFEPEGQIQFDDNTIYISLAVGYRLDFGMD